MDESHQRRLSSKPLEELTPEDLEWYAFKAITTFGTVNDFKHFLPRLFELLAYERDFPVDPEVVFGKLPYASWRDWPPMEQRAIDDYLGALWRHTTETLDAAMGMQTCLACIGQAEDSVADYLASWSAAMHHSAVARLRFADFICTGILLKDSLGMFWEESPEQGREVIGWLENKVPIKQVRKALTEWTQTPAGREYKHKFDEYQKWLESK